VPAVGLSPHDISPSLENQLIVELKCRELVLELIGGT
jgi:hypothetical protein